MGAINTWQVDTSMARSPAVLAQPDARRMGLLARVRTRQDAGGGVVGNGIKIRQDNTS